MRRWILLGLLVLAVAGYFAYRQLLAPGRQPETQPAIPEIPPTVSASGVVAPIRSVKLSFATSGRVGAVLVEEGDTVEAGQVLARLDTAGLEQNLERARATLEAARATLARLLAGPRPEDIAVAEAQVAQAEAELARLKAGPKPEEIAAAKANMEKAAAIVRLRQADYDKVKWRTDVSATPQSVALEQATLDYEAARAAYEALVRGPTAEEIRVAETRVEIARAQLAKLLAGPTPQEIAEAQARVREAEATVRAAEAALRDAELVAPFAGLVGQVSTRAGETVQAGAPVITLGDVSGWVVETTDLDEKDVPKVRVGQKVNVTFEALPGVQTTGVVNRIAPMAGDTQGGTSYRVRVALTDPVPRIRWGMTAFIEIPVEEGG